MKNLLTVALALLTGVGIGAVAAQSLHAQAKPPAYVIAEIDIMHQDEFEKEYVPAGSRAVLAGGAKYLSRGARTAAIKGEPPKRIILLTFENLDRAQATFASPAFTEAAAIGEKYARFRIYAVEGVPPQ
jgi:uncharacterized protein (DUF1330 family)